MSNKKEIYILPDYRIDPKDTKIKKILNDIKTLKEEKKYYYALYKLDSLILQDGTQEEYNYDFLSTILDNYEDIKNQIKDISSDITIDEEDFENYSKAIADCEKYNFYYFRDCFDRLEVTLSQNKLQNIIDKKKSHNSKIIDKYPEIKDDYLNLIEDIEDNTKFISPDKIYNTICEFNIKIEDEKLDKLYYIYNYLDVQLIYNNKIFDCIANNRLFLNKYSFGQFKDLGIPIGYSNNEVLKYRYLFMLIKNKIIKIDKKKKKEKDIEFVFKTFKDIFSSIKKNRFEYMNYFAFIFENIIFEGKKSISKVYKNKLGLEFSYFKILCEQFSNNRNIDSQKCIMYEESFNKKIEIKGEKAKLNYDDNIIYLNLDDYSANSFITNLIVENNSLTIIKNNSRRFNCKDKIYNEYYDDFIDLLKKICCSNVAELIQSFHEEFKIFKSFYSNEKIKNDLFENRLKFYPFKLEGLYGITDKYLLDVYLSSIYFETIDDFSSISNENTEEILYIFNMGLNSVIFQHEALNHFVRAYLYFCEERSNRKITIDTKSEYNYYPIQNLDKITEKPLYLKKFISKLSEEELDELSKKSTLDYEDLYDDVSEKEVKEKKDTNEDNKDNKDDEGYYYERQLFTDKNEKKLKKFNFFQAIMLIDEDAYNLDPFRFHYCFLELKNSKNYHLIKENFKSNLLSKLLGKIDLTMEDNIKKLTFIAKRSSDDGEGLVFTFERKGRDVMPRIDKK